MFVQFFIVMLLYFLRLYLNTFTRTRAVHTFLHWLRSMYVTITHIRHAYT
jgi:hypothetical protein